MLQHVGDPSRIVFLVRSATGQRIGYCTWAVAQEVIKVLPYLTFAEVQL